MIKIFIYLLPFLTGFIALNFGNNNIENFNFLKEVILYIKGEQISTNASIIFDIRLPRIILALIVGAVLSGCGTIMQSIFKNPLVDPFLLGISSGAAFGCALSIGIFPNFPIQILAFFISIFCAFGVLLIANLAGGSKIALILSGVVLCAFLSSFTGLIKFFVDPRYSQSISMWLLGSLSLASWVDTFIAFIALLLGFVPIYLMSYRVDVLSLEDEEAKALGINVKIMRILFIILISFSCSLVVSLSGIIGWVGLLSPHIARFIVDPKTKTLIPISLCIGSFLLLVSDTIARSISAYDLPVGAVMAIIGAPFFIILLKKSKESWN
ncbi:FecCD family ABC transporter permease [Campylobacter sputorum]|uniref:FecCD family ABC transporter permease n=1 Tax=Campylobacter sputorum TaxID=206 RepID=UPI00053BDF0A|nr:iron ABC transporter permease [Campylobacter sputorum]